MAKTKKTQEDQIEQVASEVIPPNAAVISPSVRINDKEHALEALFKKDQAPVLKSVGYAKVPGTNSYMAYTITSQGTEIIKIEVEEPNLLAIADEAARTAYVITFMGNEEI